MKYFQFTLKCCDTNFDTNEEPVKINKSTNNEFPEAYKNTFFFTFIALTFVVYSIHCI